MINSNYRLLDKIDKMYWIKSILLNYYLYLLKVIVKHVYNIKKFEIFDLFIL
jgi:hypothetical protein